MYIAILAVSRLTRPSAKLCYSLRTEKNITFLHWALKIVTTWSILGAYVLPFFLVPHTVHPLLGWFLYLLGSAALCSVVVNSLFLPPLAVYTPWLGFIGALGVMAFPWYSDGVVRALTLFAYTFCAAPFLWAAVGKVTSSLQALVEKDGCFARSGESPQLPQFSKLY